MPDSYVTRRDFIQTTAAGAAYLSLASNTVYSKATASPNEKMRIGFIGVGGRGQEHLQSAARLQKNGGPIEVAAVCDVFNRYRDASASQMKKAIGAEPKRTSDYRDIINDKSIDAVVIATPDHWHARQSLDALGAGKHVYCEKPMTHSVAEAIEVYKAWKESGLVMQVGVQSTSLPVWGEMYKRICNGYIGKVLQYQTEFFRNSDVGQWRYYELTADMTPTNIDWKMFLGSEFGLASEIPFDRAMYKQWRCYWPFGSGLFTDLFVHRTTSMLLGTGFRFPARVVGAGGIFMEFDGRDVPDVATVVADFPEGGQGIVTATMCCGETPIKQLVRGHLGSFVLGTGEHFTGFDFVAERPQVTHNSKIKSERIETGGIEDTTFAHFDNFVSAALAGKPEAVNCSPELGAAAMILVKLGAMSYREGKAYHFNRDTMQVSDADQSWAASWEKRSKERGKPLHVAGWHAGDTGSTLVPRPYQRLQGPWIDGKDPAA